MIGTSNANDARWSESITLASPEPVPFWEAVDRLAAAANLARMVVPGNPNQRAGPHVQFQSNVVPPGASTTASEDGLAAYVGPFRVGPVAVHEHFDRVFLRPAGPAPRATSPFYADVPLLAEPDLLAAQVGPIRGVEAVDDAGRSLLDPKLGGEVPAPLAPVRAGTPPSIRLPLARVPEPSKALARLRGVVPLEVARRPVSPTLVVPLAGASGKTFRDGDLAITVREAAINPRGTFVVKLSARIEGPRGEADPKAPGLVATRLWSIYQDQVELADATGRYVRMVNDSAGPDGRKPGEFLMDYTFAPAITFPRPEPPAQLRIYRPEWVAWDMPFDFRDVPLP
jgi:hypothetical protein